MVFSEEDGFRFQFWMCASVEELRAIIEREGTLSDRTETRDAVARCPILFRKSGKFEVPMSLAKTGSLLGIDTKTVWDHWRQFKNFGLDHGVTGRPKLVSEAQAGAVVDLALAEFHALRPASCNRLLWFVRSEFHIDLILDRFQVMLRRDPRLKAIVASYCEIIFSFSLGVQSSEHHCILPQRGHYVTSGRGGFADVPYQHRAMPLSPPPTRPTVN
jgi:hypothetical protein